MPTAPRKQNPAAVATIAVRSSTRAVASLSRLSPSRIATTRLETDLCLMIEVATASVGLTIAPSATPQTNPSSGITSMKNTPSTSKVTITRTTERPLIAWSSRRKFIVGIDTGGRVEQRWQETFENPFRLDMGGVEHRQETCRDADRDQHERRGDSRRGPPTLAAAITSSATTPTRSSSIMHPACQQFSEPVERA